MPPYVSLYHRGNDPTNTILSDHFTLHVFALTLFIFYCQSISQCFNCLSLLCARTSIACLSILDGGGGILFLLFSPPDEGSFLGRRKESLRISVVACCTDCKALWGKNCHKWFWAINITDLTIIFRPIRDPWGRCWHRYQEVKMWYMHTLSQRSLTYGF